VSAARVPALIHLKVHLVLAPASATDAYVLPRDLQARFEVAFARGVEHALLELGGSGSKRSERRCRQILRTGMMLPRNSSRPFSLRWSRSQSRPAMT